ncbi:hypothetical protein NL676_033614 [Syzygium grande]|nr:hypothetical protein NL676_033614 [Syzygium grande]
MFDQEEIPTAAIQGNQPMNIEDVNTAPIQVAANLEVGTNDATEGVPADTAPIISAPIRKSSRIPRPSMRLRDFSTYYTTQHPIQDFIGYDRVSHKYLSFLSVIENQHEPNTFLEASKNSMWDAKYLTGQRSDEDSDVGCEAEASELGIEAHKEETSDMDNIKRNMRPSEVGIF